MHEGAFNHIIRKELCMKKKLILSMMAVALQAALLVSCGDDNGPLAGEQQKPSDEQQQSGDNVNRNTPTAKLPELSRLEFPRVKGGQSMVVVHSTKTYGVNYAVEWDCAKKSQRWTCYEMYNSNSVSNWNRKDWEKTEWHGDPFQVDTVIPEAYRSTLKDYKNTGFDRGHICPSADRLASKEVNEQTFYLSNMQPQYPNLNRGIWTKMEERVRKWNKSSFRDTLYVCKGGTIDNTSQLINTSRFPHPVPRYFFMAILCKNKEGYKAIAFWVEHTNTDHSNDKLQNYAISIDELEEKTGIDFFCNLPDAVENRVESIMSTKSWTW